MRWLKKLLLPNCYDCFYGLSAFVIFLTVFVGLTAKEAGVRGFFGDAIQIGFVAILGGMLVGVGSAAGLGKYSRSRACWLAAACLLAPLFAYLIHLGIEQYPRLRIFRYARDVFYGQDFGEKRPIRLTSLLIVNSILVAIPLVTWIIVLGISRGPAKAKQALQKGRVTRTRVLIGIAAVMFGFVFVNNLISTAFPEYRHKFSQVAIYGLMFGIGMIVYFLFLYLPTKYLVSNDVKWRKFLAFFIAAIFLIAPIAAFNFWILPKVDLELAILSIVALLVVFLYFGAVLACYRPLSNVEDPESVKDSRQTDESRLRLVPCLVTGLLCLGLTGGLIFPYYYDVYSLFQDGDLELSRRVARNFWLSNGQLVRASYFNTANVLTFDESTDPQVLSLLDDDECANLSFKGQNPKLDFGVLKPKVDPLAVSFVESTITRNQLQDICNHPIQWLSIGDTTVTKEGDLVQPASIATMWFWGAEPKVVEVLSAFDSFENVGWIAMQHQINKEEWVELARASRTTNVSVSQLDLAMLSDEDLALAGPGMEINTSFDGPGVNANSHLYRLLNDSEVRLRLLKSYPEIVDFMFAYPKRMRLSASEVSAFKFDPRKDTEDNYFVFDWDDGEPVGLFLPFGEEDRRFMKLSRLKFLSFDERWLQDSSPENPLRQPFNISGLTELEHLAFSSSSDVVRIGFLANLKKLKHLQIPSVNRMTSGGFGFDRCPSLESIAFFGTTDSITVQELARLPKLKKLTIVDINSEFEDSSAKGAPYWNMGAVNNSGLPLKAEYRKQLEQKLPGVEISVVDVDEFQPELPEKFVEKLESTKTRLRKRLAERYSQGNKD